MQPRSPAVQRQCQQEPFPPRRLQQHGGQRSAASPAAPARSALSPSEKECDISCFYRLSLSTSQDEPVTLLQIKSHGHERGTTSRKRVCPGGVPGRADTAAAQRGAELRDKNTVVTHGTPAEGSRHEGHGRESAGSAASQHSTAQHGTTQHSTAHRGTTQHGAAQHGSDPPRAAPTAAEPLPPAVPDPLTAAPSSGGPHSLEVVQGVNAAGGLPVPAAHPAPGAAEHAGGARRGLSPHGPAEKGGGGRIRSTTARPATGAHARPCACAAGARREVLLRADCSSQRTPRRSARREPLTVPSFVPGCGAAAQRRMLSGHNEGCCGPQTALRVP